MRRQCIKIAVGQLRCTESKTSNLATISAMAERAAREGCQIIFLPENADYIAEGREAMLKLAEPLEGPTLSEYRRIARTNRLWMNVGSVHELMSAEKISNTQIVLDDEGEIRATYRKIHLFDVNVPGGRKYQESMSTIPGEDLVVCDTPVGRLGLTTCYDVRFAEQYHELATTGNADILTCPSAFMVPTGQAHWHVLLRARAVETQCFVVAAAQAGAHNAKRTSYGHSLVIDPWGKVLMDLGCDGEAFDTVVLDSTIIPRVRADLPVRNHRVPMKWRTAVPPLPSHRPLHEVLDGEGEKGADQQQQPEPAVL